MEFKGVRLANASDEDRLFDFLQGLKEENALFPMSERKTREAIQVVIGKHPQHKGFCGIIEHGNGIEAAIGVVPATPWYSEEWYLDEIWNYVHPDYRRTEHAKKLLEFAKFMATFLQAPIVMSVVTRKRLAGKMRLFQRQMPQIGAWFVWGKEFDDMYNQKNTKGN